MQIRKCDKCKKKLSEYPSKEGVHGSINGSVSGYIVFFDFCNNCAKKFLNSIRGYVKIKT